jgi:hypothetical protein
LVLFDLLGSIDVQQLQKLFVLSDDVELKLLPGD